MSGRSSHNPNMARRSFFLTFSSLAVCALTQGTSAVAQQLVSSQSEWQQDYDASSQLRAVRSSTPILSTQAASATEQAIRFYKDLVARGGWSSLSINSNLRIGSNSHDVIALRRRLIASGDLDPNLGSSSIYDSYVEAAVKRFQGRHGLLSTGQMSPVTLATLNVPAQTRLRQLEVNLIRLRSYSGNLGSRYVIVNIPGARVETVENGRVYSRHAAGVGKADRQSPIMNAKITQVNFNPFWTVPASIIRKDLIPLMREQPSYLTDNKIRIFNKQGKELNPADVNWDSNEATNYMFRQDPGGDLNSMGFVRINIPNPYGVYMHDTPAKGVFGDDYRFVSSGCVRVQNVRGYLQFLLKENSGWNRSRIEEEFEGGQRRDVSLARPVPVYWTYITAWATPDGLVQFRNDIYNRDGIQGASVPMMESDQPDYNDDDVIQY